MTPAEQLALWADRLRGLSAMGLRFSHNTYDLEHYREVQTISMEMLAAATGEPWERIEPRRAPIFSQPTPFIAGEGAVIDADGRVLLIRRADNGRWAMPGGALEVGETPAEGTVREVREETGVHCQAVGLIGIFDSRLCGTPTRHHLYQLVFLCQPLGPTPGPPSHAQETLGLGWFTEQALPEDMDPGHRSRLPLAFRAWQGESRTFFDGTVWGHLG
jgi:ADP-ribose pyrophosphatase YjhB (NUDIX family)